MDKTFPNFHFSIFLSFRNMTLCAKLVRKTRFIRENKCNTRLVACSILIKTTL